MDMHNDLHTQSDGYPTALYEHKLLIRLLMVSIELQKHSSTTSNKLRSCIILPTLIIGHIP